MTKPAKATIAKELGEGFPWGAARSASLSALALAVLTSFIVSLVMKPKINAKTKLKRGGLGIEGDLNLVEESISFADVKTIIKRNIFNRDGEVPGNDEKKNKNQGYEVATTLPVKLLGVIHGGAKFNGVAIIKDSRKPNPGSFVVGDEVSEGSSATLIEIYPRKVILSNGGQREYLLLEEKPIMRSRRLAARKAKSGNSFKIGRVDNSKTPVNYSEDGFERKGNKAVASESFRQRMLTDGLAKALQDAKAVPHTEGGEILGWKLTKVREGSIYRKFGIENNDIIKEINGVPATSAPKMIRFLNKLKTAENYEIVVERNGKAVTKTLDVTE